MQKDLEDKKQDISNLNELVKKQEKSKLVNSYVKKSDKFRLSQHEEDYKLIENEYKKQKENILVLKKNQRIIANILYKSWVNNIVDINEFTANVRNQQLKTIIKMKNEYLGISKGIHKPLNNKIFGEKCTPKLFETYIYVLLIKMLINEGYVLKNYNFETDNMIPVLSNQSKLVFYKGFMRCEIGYDYELKKSNDVLNGNEFVTINSHYNRPDFIISFFEENDEIPKSIVVEVKWRPLSVIYNENGDTEIVTKLKDYYSLGYHIEIPRKKTLRGIIQKVLVVFPDKKQRVVQIQENEIIGIGLEPNQNINESKIYHELKNYIFEFE